MKHVFIIILVVFSLFEDQKSEANTQDLKVLNFDELQSYLGSKDESKTYVVNFWATWCAPCVKELPYFEQLNANYVNKSVEVILVSLDFPKQIDTKLKPFLKKHNLKSEVLVLDDVDSNTWIPKVNKNWSGAIPATLIYNKDKKEFYERSFDYQGLETQLKQFIK
ncbi:TlpA disulfide reductase family protein [Psychroserpens algicola]|uniref:TlpA disulfide reductase family protein n=1 Tax=Psychroserpens algicola TaxID=1719034 RepID=UPI001953BE46|nr:TlpA disulfide reductase family protein [Psychroserpens algicola]